MSAFDLARIYVDGLREFDSLSDVDMRRVQYGTASAYAKVKTRAALPSGADLESVKPLTGVVVDARNCALDVVTNARADLRRPKVSVATRLLKTVGVGDGDELQDLTTLVAKKAEAEFSRSRAQAKGVTKADFIAEAVRWARLLVAARPLR